MNSLAPHSDRNAYGVDRSTSDGCEVNQAFMIMRHDECYPDYTDFGDLCGNVEPNESQCYYFKGLSRFYERVGLLCPRSESIIPGVSQRAVRRELIPWRRRVLRKYLRSIVVMKIVAAARLHKQNPGPKITAQVLTT
ncbi:acid phosphatase PHO3 [Penicillium sp. IBT 35674x]|nr:acid phosphatase PHO3 [Penicillium sp. IBT 35674x]